MTYYLALAISEQIGEYADFPVFFAEKVKGNYVLSVEGVSEYQTQPFKLNADPSSLSLRITNIVSK